MKKELERQKKPKRKKIVLVILGILCLLGFIFPFLLNIYLKHKLPDLINEKTPYRISLEDFDLSLLKGNISANSITIGTKPTQDPAVTQISGDVKSLQIENFRIWNAVFNKTYKVDDIKLIDPNIQVVAGRSKKKKDSTQKKINFGIENIFVQNGNISVKGNDKKDLFTGKNININLTDIRQSQDASKIPVAFKDFKIDAHDVLITVNEFYRISASKIDAKNKQLRVSEFHLKPIESPALYNAKNVFDLKINQLTADNFTIDKDSLIVQNAIFSQPKLIVTSTHKKTVKENPKEVNLKIGIKNLDFQQGSVLIQQQDKTKTASVDNFRVNLQDIVFDKNTVKEKIPFAFSTHHIEFENIYFKTDPLQAVSIKKISSDNSDIFISDARFNGIGKSNTKDVFNIKTEKIEILNNTSKFVGQQLQLKLDEINVYAPDISITAATHKNKSAKKTQNQPPDLMVNLGALNIINGTFSQEKQGIKKMKVGNFNIKLNSVTADKNTLKESIPFQAKSHMITAKAIDVDAGKYYRLKANQIQNTGKTTQISNFAFLPKYSRNQFNKMIAVEEDLYTIKVKSMNIVDKNSVIGGKTSIDLDHIIFDGVDCNIYHDLAPSDDIGVRYMFSKKLRDVKFPLYVKQVDIKNSKLTYEEIAEKAQIPGKITFDHFNAKIANVNSAKMKGKPTLIQVDSDFKFFGDAPTDVHWQFDVANIHDDYAINGTIKDLSVENANLFVRPYLNVSLDGKINYLKFDYKGNSKKIGGNFYFKYTDMHVNFMNKNTGKERKILTAIANIFVKNDSKGEPDHMEVDKERDPNKSFFNTLWQGIMEGLKKYLI
ncbi:hypothetical protein ACM46_21010 [Chryseobacterium angstadtii]|uniref:DUF748 domain-containing protein n=1 Tax=Chryseobacterium angstadtii TaxID=558151 RepID=A0A0J7HZV5_9FLAO|nr:hypothetical protein [Chryseobacterium angstadtii]KMQ59557.1 hypothetical protein ACM46_21010 [Chryseobacterium angstadtii]